MPTCYGQYGSHQPTVMEELENAIGDPEYECPACGVLISGD